jgi:hypothetical protein
LFDIAEHKNILGIVRLVLAAEACAAILNESLKDVSVCRKIESIQTRRKDFEVIKVTWSNFAEQKHRCLRESGKPKECYKR